MVRKRQLTKEDRQTIITPQSAGLSFREYPQQYPLMYAKIIRVSSNSKITTQNIPPGYVRTTVEEKNKTVGFKSWNGQYSLQT